MDGVWSVVESFEIFLLRYESLRKLTTIDNKVVELWCGVRAGGRSESAQLLRGGQPASAGRACLCSSSSDLLPGCLSQNQPLQEGPNTATYPRLARPLQPH